MAGKECNVEFVKFMKKTTLYSYLLATSVALALSEVPLALAENPTVGFNRVRCPAKSDTFVSVPLMRLPIRASKTLASAPTLAKGQATLTPAESTEWAANEFQNTHYVRFITGALAGRWYEIVGNTASGLTIDLNGEAGASFAPSDAFMVVKFWTLDTLFPPGSQKTFHTSTGNLGYQQKSKLLIPNVEAAGINLPAKDIYFLTSEGWKQSIEGYPYAGSRILPPGLPLIIRHPAGVTTTNFEPVGRVLYSPDSVVLNQDKDKPQDNTVAVFRPVDVRLVDSDLDETVFSSSSSHESGARKDELLVFDNSLMGFNKSPSALFYKYSQAWFRDEGKADSNSPVVAITLPASGALIIRKTQEKTSSSFWKNQPTY
jgi:uncharacterized protein (TIGR02597 family)